MVFSYGNGEYLEGGRRISGEIMLSEHKLYLKSETGDLTQTYIPLEKIKSVKLTHLGLEIAVYPSVSFQYICLIRGQRKNIRELVKDLVDRRQLKKHWFFPHWKEEIL